MVLDLKHKTGEELLLISVLGGPQVQDCIDCELDRRALLGKPLPARRPSSHPNEPRHAA